MAEWFSPAQPSSDPTLCVSMSPLERLLHKARCALTIKKQADSAAIGLNTSATGFTFTPVPEESVTFLPECFLCVQ